jgi:hypothetical protein
MPNLKVNTIEDGDVYVDLDKLPDACPICRRAIEPVYQKTARLDDSKDRVELVFLCPRRKCQSFFVARFHQSPYSSTYRYSGSVPFEPMNAEFSEEIEAVSPDFCKIANEAENAERQGWKLVAGPGYRKALEYLIKDYLCKLKPAQAEKIKSMQLGTCIEDYVDNENVKQMARRAA